VQNVHFMQGMFIEWQAAQQLMPGGGERQVIRMAEDRKQVGAVVMRWQSHVVCQVGRCPMAVDMMKNGRQVCRYVRHASR